MAKNEISNTQTAKANKRTPMLEQYWQFREKVPANTLLLFRCGDFYEMFEDDAIRGAELLGVTLTKRGGAPLAGIPYHAIDNYLSKALRAGVKIAICEQQEIPKPGKLVKRALVRIITPGTTFEEAQLDSKANNYILAIDETRDTLCAAWADATTGEFFIADSKDKNQLVAMLSTLRPSEILVPASWAEKSVPEHLAPLIEWNLVTRLEDWKFGVLTGEERVAQALGTNSLAGFGIARGNAALGPAGAIICYLADMLCQQTQCFKKITRICNDDILLIDQSSVKNLEIFESATRTRAGTLLAAIDKTKTAAGARLLAHWLETPPRDLPTIHQRQNCVGEFVALPSATNRVRDSLAQVRDLPRILARLKTIGGTPNDLGQIRETLRRVPEIKRELTHFDSPFFADFLEGIGDHSELCDLLNNALVDPIIGNAQSIINLKFDEKLKNFQEELKKSVDWRSEYELKLIQETGIPTLKIVVNAVFGWCIEITKANRGKTLPPNFVRRQTLANAERYVTPELQDHENASRTLEEKFLMRSREIYDEIVARILQENDALLKTAGTLAQIDVLAGWAVLAQTWDYCKPLVDDSATLEISQGRHPVVEQMIADGNVRAEKFVPNDTSLQADNAQIGLITGPNMAGKSTYIRQVALITLLAQIGCYVPAKSAHIGVCDRIFCRVGASDELTRGNSTFMVEMNETANILNNATEKSLVILDEIGRGTSTYDGLSIAWAVVEYLHGNAGIGPRTLFATHYHELTRIASSLPRVKNFCVVVKEWNGEIIFVRQVVPGSIERSYGIHVAKLAGLPAIVINRATEILNELENHAVTVNYSFPQAKLLSNWAKNANGGNGETGGNDTGSDSALAVAQNRAGNATGSDSALAVAQNRGGNAETARNAKVCEENSTNPETPQPTKPESPKTVPEKKSKKKSASPLGAPNPCDEKSVPEKSSVPAPIEFVSPAPETINPPRDDRQLYFDF